ncbi:YeeE/YedE thiosulfate transporter family protein [Thermodesulfobacterium thermophilum]|uniref:YeeE/YedE thiosulfate transporter family protein n=1 Tax=Thermodesulfobacterium thermophilum TaxID=886 RepID=UPI0003B3B25A|nr:YeeE/YedE thiosulfate transporter family protein [Thermodesulfobacterium thermophilum]
MDVRVGGILLALLLVLGEYFGAPWGITNQPFFNLFVLWLGAFFSANLFKECGLRIPSNQELIKSFMAGILMGIGAFLATGDNITSFVMPFVNLSAGSLVVLVGLWIGGFIGIKYQLKELEKKQQVRAIQIRFTKLNPLLALLSLGVLVWLCFKSWDLVFWAAIGMVLQKSNWCMVNTLKEPFFSEKNINTQAVVLTLGLAVLGIWGLKFYQVLEPYTYVLPNFGILGLVGGIIFGLGMLLAGSCGASLFAKSGEGDLKSFITLGVLLSCYKALNSTISLSFLQGPLKDLNIYLPDYFGYSGALLISLVVLGFWLTFSWWNSKTKKLLKRYYI